MAKFLDLNGVEYLWGKIKNLISSSHKVTDGSNYTNQTSTSFSVGTLDGDQTIISKDGIILSGGSLTVYEDTSKGGDSVSLNFDEITKLKSLQNIPDALRFKGTLGSGGTVTTLPSVHAVGDTYKVITAGSYAGQTCEVGDLVICIKAGNAANNADWTVAQSNIDGAVTGPTSSVKDHVAIFGGTNGKTIVDSGYNVDDLSIETATLGIGSRSVINDLDVPNLSITLQMASGDSINSANAPLQINAATTSIGGLMSKSDKSKLNGIANGATADSALTTGEIDGAIS